MPNDLDQLCVDTIRVLTMDSVQKANSGHPGMPMGMADAAYVLWDQYLKHNPVDPAWPNRDRFVLSAGHGSMLLYSLLYLTGYDLPLEQLKQFRQWDSLTPGHPEYGDTPGVETTTGPLGQGFANGVGMALAERMLAAQFNRPGFEIVDHHTYAIVSDGDLMEGISHEAASLAGHLGLGKLIYLYDDNHITIEGDTALTYSDDVRQRFESYGWQVIAVNGHDRVDVSNAIRRAHDETERPTLIMCRTHIAYGSPNKQDTAKAHGEPLGIHEVRLAKEAMGWAPDTDFAVPERALAHFRTAVNKGAEVQSRWEALFAVYEAGLTGWGPAFFRSRTAPSGRGSVANVAREQRRDRGERLPEPEFRGHGASLGRETVDPASDRFAVQPARTRPGVGGMLDQARGAG